MVHFVTPTSILLQNNRPFLRSYEALTSCVLTVSVTFGARRPLLRFDGVLPTAGICAVASHGLSADCLGDSGTAAATAARFSLPAPKSFSFMSFEPFSAGSTCCAATAAGGGFGGATCTAVDSSGCCCDAVAEGSEVVGRINDGPDGGAEGSFVDFGAAILEASVDGL